MPAEHLVVAEDATWDRVGMGCTPSIHVNQTGVVYCRDSDESVSPRGSYSAGYHTHIVRTDTSEIASGFASVSSGRTKKRDDMKDLSPGAIAITEAETQTSQSHVKVPCLTACHVRLYVVSVFCITTVSPSSIPRQTSLSHVRVPCFIAWQLCCCVFLVFSV